MAGWLVQNLVIFFPEWLVLSNSFSYMVYLHKTARQLTAGKKQLHQQVPYWSQASMLIITRRDADPEEYLIAYSQLPTILPAPAPPSLLCTKGTFFSFPERACHGMAAWAFCCPHSMQQRCLGGNMPDPVGIVSNGIRKAKLNTGDRLMPWKANRNHGVMLLCDVFPNLSTEPNMRLLKPESLHYYHIWFF